MNKVRGTHPTGFLLFELQYQAFAGLRIPRVVISVLPDEQLPGNMPSPILTENTVQINSKTELMLQVNIRESEATTGFAEFEIPVYAVNDTGSQMSNLNGLFKARFNALPDSEVVDGVMIGGKAYIKVKVPISTFADGASQLDLTQMRVYSAPTCDTSSFYQLPTNIPLGTGVPTTFSVAVFGCNTLTATYDAPVGTPVEAYPYTIPADYLTRTNRIFLGKDGTEQTKYDDNLKDVPGNVATLVIGFIPILGDSVDLLTQVYNTAVGKEVDAVMATLATAGLVLDITTGGIGDVTAGLKGVYRISRSFGGFFADLLKQSVEELFTGRSVRQVLDELAVRFGTMAQVFLRDGFAGVKSADQLGNALKNAPVCPIALRSSGNFQPLGLCDPKEIGKVVNSLANGPLKTKLSTIDMSTPLKNICCNPPDGNGNIPGADQVIQYLKSQGDSATPQVGNIKGAIAEAIAGDTLRGKFGADFKYPLPSDYKLNGQDVQIDLAGTDLQGTFRLIQVKNIPEIDQEQYITMIKVTPTGARPSVFFNAKDVSRSIQDILFCNGIDILKFDGSVLNKAVRDIRGCDPLEWVF